MDWANERWIRLYTRDTGDWLMWPWQTRALFLFILRKVDRAGMLQLGKGKLSALAAIIGMPSQDVTEWIAPLPEDGCIQIHDGELLIPNYIPAQEVHQTDRARQRASRERARDKFVAANGREPTTMDLQVEAELEAAGLGLSSQAVTPTVTGCHTPSHEVTLDKTRQEETRREESAREGAPPHSTSVPESSEATAPERPRPPGGGKPGTNGLSGPVPGCGAVASGDAEEGAIYARLCTWPIFAVLDRAELAKVLSMRAFQWKKKLNWTLTAIDDCATKKAGIGLNPEALQGTLVSYVRNASEPREDRAATKPPALVDDDDPAAVARIRRGPKRVTAQDGPTPAAGARDVKALLSGIAPAAPRQPMTEAELADKARRDRERLADEEKKLAGNGGGG